MQNNSIFGCKYILVKMIDLLVDKGICKNKKNYITNRICNEYVENISTGEIYKYEKILIDGNNYLVLKLHRKSNNIKLEIKEK